MLTSRAPHVGLQLVSARGAKGAGRGAGAGRWGIQAMAKPRKARGPLCDVVAFKLSFKELCQRYGTKQKCVRLTYARKQEKKRGPALVGFHQDQDISNRFTTFLTNSGHLEKI